MPFRLLDVEVSEIAWRDLTLKEQASLIRQGYKPAEGEILFGNIDLEAQHVQPDSDTRGDRS